MSLTNSQKIHIPPDMNYTCAQCSRGCTVFDEIRVTEEFENNVEQLRLTNLARMKEGQTSPLKVSEMQDEYLILERNKDGCIFLDDDCLCTIHKKFGLEKKPQTCQDFPYQFVEYNDEIYLGMSFVCTSILSNHGPPLSEEVDEVPAKMEKALSHRQLLKNPCLTKRHQISSRAYEEIETSLKQILHYPDYTLGQKLLMQAVYLDLVYKTVRQVRGDNPGSQTGKGLDSDGIYRADSGQLSDADTVSAVSRRYLVDDGMRELLRLGTKVKPSKSLQRGVLGVITSFRESLNLKRGKVSRLRSISTLVFSYMKYTTGMGKVNFYPDESLNNLDNDVFDKACQEKDSDELLQRYFEHILFRKDLIAGGSIILTQRVWLFYYAYIMHGRKDYTEEELDKYNLFHRTAAAISSIELKYLLHGSFGKLFSDFPQLGIMVDRITSRPIYLPSMVIEPD